MRRLWSSSLPLLHATQHADSSGVGLVRWKCSSLFLGEAPFYQLMQECAGCVSVVSPQSHDADSRTEEKRTNDCKTEANPLMIPECVFNVSCQAAEAAHFSARLYLMMNIMQIFLS